jgi:hypothetical protein
MFPALAPAAQLPLGRQRGSLAADIEEKDCPTTVPAVTRELLL